MAEAVTVQCGEVITMTADGTYTKGDVVQVPDGRAGIVLQDATSGNPMSVDVTRGAIYEVEKTTSMVMLIGSKVFWDYSANKAHLLHVNDRDFALGAVMLDAASAATTVKVALNVEPTYTVALEHGFSTLPISTAGWPHVFGAGKNGVNMIFDLATEAQKLDALSLRALSLAALAESICDILICVNDKGDDAALDLNVGVANGTHATDGDSITESMFVHIDGNSLNINLESDDGGTEVAATDTTVDYVEGTPFLVQFDFRNTSDIQAYVNGVNVLPSSVFKLNAAAGPIRVLAHLEKSSNNTPGNVSVLNLGIRTAQNMV